MSRIIVKGLPVYLTDDKLKEHFVARLKTTHPNTTSLVDSLITDVKILKDKNGTSRRFAFIGFLTEDDARDAIRYFNGSFIDTARIQVSEATSFADPNRPKSVKEKRMEALKRVREREQRLLEEEEANKKVKIDKNEKRHAIDAEIEKNKQLKEFMETMKPNSQVSSWENASVSTSTNPLLAAVQNQDEDDRSNGSNPLLQHALSMKGDDIVADKESDDEYEDFNKPTTVEDADEQMVSLDNFNSNTQDHQEVSNNEDEKNLGQDETVSDLDWLKQRRIRIRDGENEEAKPRPINKENEGGNDTVEEEKIPGVEAEPEKSQEELAIEKISSTGRLFLRNILYTSTEKDFRDLFEPFGELEEVHVALDTRTGQSKGFAYVLYKDSANAVQAYINLDKQIFQGRLLHILPGESKKSHRLDEFDIKNMPLKKQRELKRKDTASKQTFSWNSLYMNQDAVLGSVASKLGIEKSQLIDAENSNSAVKQALAEAHVIGDVRKYFEDKGVDIASFSVLRSTNKRDDTVILVKNFPFGTTVEELSDLFLPFGKIDRFLMPPAGTIAIIQYRDVTSARAAFRSLAYKRFKSGIIYLEKGPSNCFTRDANATDGVESSTPKEEEVKEIKPSIGDMMEVKTSNNEEQDSTDNVVDGPTVSIFIKNLNFSTTSQQLSQQFKNFNGFIVAQVKTKSDPKIEGKILSMGFGFAEFKTKEQALAAISAMDGSVIDGHKIQIKLSHRQGTASKSNVSQRKPSGKIIVKNLPFEATRKDVFELFSSFGQLKSVRVPKKFDKSARGFAFVEFLLPKEAENAMDQLQGVHLLGRRLVIQYAQAEAVDAEEEISRMTKKARKQMATREYGSLKSSGGRKKLEMDDGDDGLDGP
ncbi:hypothetical protein TPHA_0D03960 [Tetrapisispora phaffii CBS 4417]|uniref:Multiple RNA-binding domain-containing protein 1 n=1 Tax=Tetrapisispora phaffii (strain ATCC 24235 / CBS 4417 / NBRC 1672 / NRRL Y-8282 / UCD 70-5) TaxID=1071381 RepID=G8BT58_TETPH|nr:hypothetical protein TPHA_0D03960 [Tetrapisispora phaffii CBS 4417]CCE63029.1 hypothetical protein TPHA_0D03960 [Tetrapisispora phaffii CBS 4417]